MHILHLRDNNYKREKIKIKNKTIYDGALDCCEYSMKDIMKFLSFLKINFSYSLDNNWNWNE